VKITSVRHSSALPAEVDAPAITKKTAKLAEDGTSNAGFSAARGSVE